MRKYVFRIFAITFLFAVLCHNISLPVCAVPKQQPQTSKSAVITVPAGEVIKSVLTTPVNSQKLMQGHIITLVLSEDFYYNGKMIIPADSVVSGSVISIKRSGDFQEDKLLLRFSQIITPYGVTIPIFALLKTGEKSGLLMGNQPYYGDDQGHVSVNVGTPFDLLLTQPITVNPEIYNSNY